MSTGKRLAKRSIIGTRVAALGDDGKYYTGLIHALISPASAAGDISPEATPDTCCYVVRFDSVPGGKPLLNSKTEFHHNELIGPGFGLVSSASLVSGQKVYLTYNGREINAEVIDHRKDLDEVDVLFAPSGQEGKITLTRRIDEIRLLKSRKSARLADQDTDFARLADMAGDRKRAPSNSIEVPYAPGSRKRRQSTSSDNERSYSGGGSAGTSSGSGNGTSGSSEIMGIPHRCGREGCAGFNDRGDCMDECSAALVLMSLSCSPHSPHATPYHYLQNYGCWRDQATTATMVGSPGTGGASSSSSSGASWRTGTPSPSLSEDGAPTNRAVWPTPTQHPPPLNVSGLPYEGTPNGALDEGIVPDYMDDTHPLKKKIRSRQSRELVENNSPTNRKKLFKCNWRGCGKIKATCQLIEYHVRQVHLRKQRDTKANIKDEEFYYDELTLDHVSSPPTMSHRDMARPPHEDPEYQKLLRLEAAPVAMISTGSGNGNGNNINSYRTNNANTSNVTIPAGVIRDGSSNIFTFGVSPSSQQVQQSTHQHQEKHQQEEQMLDKQEQQQQQQQQQQQLHHHEGKLSSAVKQLKLSPRPLQVCQPNVRVVAVPTGKMTSSRKVRSQTIKCRKFHGMMNREKWCTQCRWKKACSRIYGE